MSPVILAILAFISIGALGVAFVPALLGPSKADKRRQALQGDRDVIRANMAAERTRDSRRKTVQKALQTQSDALHQKRKFPLQARIFQAGMTISKVNFIRNSIIFGVVLFVVAFVLQVPLPYAAVFALSGGYVLPMWFLKFRRTRFQAKFLEELPNAVEAIVRGIKAGMPLNDSLRVIASEVMEPVRAEFARVIEQQAIGKSMMEAIQVLYERVPVAEVNFLVVVITVQQQAGGNLAEALTNLSRVLRNRKKMKAKIKAMSSEAKASSMIIGSLPFLVGTLVSIVSPAYLVPLFTTSLGHMALAGGALMMFMGGFIMNRMIQFDY